MRQEQSVLAGSQFDGTAGKGLFVFTNKGGTKINRITLEMGGELKDYLIRVIDDVGNEVAELVKYAADTAKSIVVPFEIFVDVPEKLQVVTTGATSGMTCTVIWEPIVRVDGV